MFSEETFMIEPFYFLYHFTTADTFLNHILESGKLRFSPYFKTNDPKETLPWHFTLSSSYFEKYFKYNEITVDPIKKRFFDESQHQIQNKIRKNAKIACFSKDHFDKGIKDARGYNHPRMWSQYAENHTGVCLIINKNVFDSSLYNTYQRHKIFKGEVKYDYTPLNFRILDALNIDINEYTTNDIEELTNTKINEFKDIYFFTKHFDWSNEYEYRYVIIHDSNEYAFVPILEALEGIIFGVNVSEKHKKEIMSKGKSLKETLRFGQYVYVNSITTAVEI